MPVRSIAEIAVVTVACVASELNVTRQVHSEGERAAGPEDEHRDQKRAFGEVEKGTYRIADDGAVSHAGGKARRAGGRHKKRQHHEGCDHNAQPSDGRPREPTFCPIH